MVKPQGAIPAIGEGGIFGGGGAEFECRRTADRLVSGAGDIAMQGDVTETPAIGLIFIASESSLC